MSGFLRIVALLVACSTGAAPAVLEACATTCQAHAAGPAATTARAGTVPPCHHAATATPVSTRASTRAVPDPEGCGHDHHTSLATLSAERPLTVSQTLAAPAVPQPHELFRASARLVASTRGAPPGARPPFVPGVLPLRI